MGLTVKLLEDSLDGAGAAAAGHGDVEFVDVLCHPLRWRGGIRGNVNRGVFCGWYCRGVVGL